MGSGRRFMQVLGHPVLHLALHMQMRESVSLSFPIAIDIVYGLQDHRGIVLQQNVNVLIIS